MLIVAAHSESDEQGPSLPRPDGKRVRQNIINAARAVFAEKGYSGAKVNEIVLRAQTTKPMVYYYFGSKERLFAAVLEDVYAGMRDIERSLQLADLPALEAMRQVVQVTFDYHAEHPEWVRLVSIANIHYAKHIVGSKTIALRNLAIVEIMKELLKRGVDEGVFRSDTDPLHIHLLIISLSFYRVSNRHTWRVIFERDLEATGDAKLQRNMTVEAVLRYLRSGGD
ncbi:transcriptional regulator, TetR family [Rhizobiales bacterium GAS191]|nr:transcriptional regulator, TetR family [Rhizobiales bacterium GAS191]